MDMASDDEDRSGFLRLGKMELAPTAARREGIGNAIMWSCRERSRRGDKLGVWETRK